MNYTITYTTKEDEKVTIQTLTYYEAKEYFKKANKNGDKEIKIIPMNNIAKEEMLFMELAEIIVKDLLKGQELKKEI